MFTFSLDTFWVSLMAVGKAGALASTGVLLHRRGFVASAQAKQTLSRYSQQIALPCLFFSKITSKEENNNEDLDNSSAWFLLLVLWPLYVVATGLLVGHGMATMVGIQSKEQKTALLVTTAFANSTGLPTTLLSLMANAMQGNSDPMKQLTVYLMVYPVLMWGVGGTLLGLGEPVPARESERPSATGGVRMITFSRKSSSDEGATEDDTVDESDHDPLLTRDEEDSLSTNLNNLPDASSMSMDCHSLWSVVQRALYQPPVLGALTGWIVVSIPVLQYMWNEGCLAWLGEAVHTVGQAAIPMNMAVLGINLSMTMSSEAKLSNSVDVKLVISVVVGKLIVMPLLGLLSVYFLKAVLNLEGSVAAVMALVWCTPSANTLMVMSDLSRVLPEQMKVGMARLLAAQYTAAPFLLSLWVMCTLQLANSTR